MHFFSVLLLLGHNIKPAYLEVNAQSNNSYAIKWKVPLAKDPKVVTLKPDFPKGCKEQTGSRYSVEDKMLKLSYWNLTCEEGLIGKVIHIDGLDQSMMDVLVHVHNGKDFSYVKRLTSTTNQFKVLPSPSRWTIIESYLPLGIKHILIGFDHLLFVLGLILIISRAKVLFLTISSFTLAHSITLGLTTLGVVYPSSTLIEVLIALSIVILAVEVIYSFHGKYGLFARYPWMIAFLFGLIHGFGFASVLIELGIPQSYLLTALISFNVGIELGQLLFISFLLGCYLLLSKYLPSKKLLEGKIILTYFIGMMASYWLIERVYS